MAAAPRSDPRVLNYGTGPPDDGLERGRDICPDCGGERWQLVIVPDRFYCDRCEKSTYGPNTAPPAEPEPEQIGLFASTTEAASNEGEEQEERAPLDEGDAWIASEMPDE